MAASNEVRMISRVIRLNEEGDPSGLRDLINKGITPEMIPDKATSDVYKYILDSWEKHSSIPSRAQIKQHWPDYRFIAVTDALGLIVDEFMDWYKQQDAIKDLQDASEMAEEGKPASEIDKVIMAGVARRAALSGRAHEHVNVVKHGKEIKQEYIDRKNRPAGLIGYTTGFPTLDKITNGVRPGNFVGITASPKVGKSILALVMAIAAHEVHNVPIGYLSLEMSVEENKLRYAAIRAGVSLTKLTEGTLTPAEEAALDRMLARVKDPKFEPFTMLDGVSGMTVPEVAAQIDTINAKIVVIDGLYMLSDTVHDPGTPQALTNISRALKQVALNKDIILIGTTQSLLAKMKGVKLGQGSIGYSSAYLQDTDLMLGLEDLDPYDAYSRNLVVLASRNSGREETELLWNFDTGEFREWTPGSNGRPVPIP